MNTRFAIKYGLPREPSDHQVTFWRVRYLGYKVQGLAPEEAGHKAASETFDGYGTVKYASQADTIEALLDDIGKKDK